jgi:flagellar assembly factor FliW
VQGIDSAAPSFIAVDPHRLIEGYRTELAQSDRARLKADPDTRLLWLALVTANDHGATVNLRAPLVINPDTMLGVQVVTVDSPYPLDHPLTGL